VDVLDKGFRNHLVFVIVEGLGGVMKAVKYVLAVAVLVGFAMPANAQDVKKIEVNLGAGFTVPYQESGKTFGTGGNFLAGVTFNFNEHMGVEANYGYTRFGRIALTRWAWCSRTRCSAAASITARSA